MLFQWNSQNQTLPQCTRPEGFSIPTGSSSSRKHQPEMCTFWLFFPDFLRAGAQLLPCWGGKKPQQREENKKETLKNGSRSKRLSFSIFSHFVRFGGWEGGGGGGGLLLMLSEWVLEIDTWYRWWWWWWWWGWWSSYDGGTSFKMVVTARRFW